MLGTFHKLSIFSHLDNESILLKVSLFNSATRKLIYDNCQLGLMKIQDRILTVSCLYTGQLSEHILRFYDVIELDFTGEIMLNRRNLTPFE